MEIHHFPQVQIHGNHATIREDGRYIDLGFYDREGNFEWSPEGVARRDMLVSKLGAEIDVSSQEQLDIDPSPIVDESASVTLDDDPEFAKARARSAARNSKKPAKGSK